MPFAKKTRHRPFGGYTFNQSKIASDCFVETKKKELLPIALTLTIISAAPSMADQFDNPYLCKVVMSQDECR
jgi:hypothetical protein